MRVALRMTSPWLQSYEFVTKNAGRLANDLAMGTGIRIRDENAGRLANDPARIQSDEIVTKDAVRFSIDLAMGTVIRIPYASRIPTSPLCIEPK